MILKFQKQKQVQLKKLFKDQQKSDNYTQRFKSKKLPFYCNQQVNFINKGLGKLKKLEKRFQKQSINLLEKDQKQANRFIQEKTKSYKKNTFTKGLEVHEFSKGEQNYLNIRIVYEKEKHQNISTIKLLRMNRNEQALEYIDQAINKNSDKDEYYAVKASILFQLNRNEEALEQFGYAIHKNPDIDKYYASKELKKLQNFFDYSNPDKDSYYALKGQLKLIKETHTLMQINRNEEALEFFEYAINRNPDDDINYAFKAHALMIMNRNEEALKYIDYAIKRNPTEINYYSQKEEILFQLNRNKEILDYQSLAFQKKNENSDFLTHKWMSYIYQSISNSSCQFNVDEVALYRSSFYQSFQNN